jgi:hypothetical protein
VRATLVGLGFLAGLSSTACGKDDVQADGLLGASDVTQRTGASIDQAAHDRDQRASDLLVEKRRLVEAAGATLELSRLTSAPLLEARVEIEGWNQAGQQPTFRGQFRYRITNTSGVALDRMAFEVPVNQLDLQAGRPATVRLEAVTVDGAPVSADGTASRWEVPVQVVAGDVALVVLTLSGLIPDAARPASDALLQAELDTLPELTRLVATMPAVSPLTALGHSSDTLILSGCFPRLVGPPNELVTSLEVVGTAPAFEPDMLVAATGVRQPGAPHRFVAVPTRDLAVVVSRRAAETSQALAGRRLTLHLPRAPGTADPSIAQVEAEAEVVRLVRRSIEVLEGRWGRLEASALTVVATPLLDGRGMVALPGIVVIPVRGTPLETKPVTNPNAPNAPKDTPRPGVFERILARHPAPREALERGVYSALARQWWIGKGSGAMGRLLESGMAADGALAVLRSAQGDKAQRRAIELGWRLPYQLERLRGEPDPALINPGGELPVGGSIVDLKVGLAFENLARSIGAVGWEAMSRELLASSEPIDYERFLAVLSKHAPRPEAARALAGRWLTERQGDLDVGEFRPEVILEYLVADGAVGGLTDLLVDELGTSKLGGKAVGLLASGQGLDSGLAIAMLGELIGPELDPQSRRWVELATGLFSQDSRKDALSGLVDELGAELGIPESDRSRLKAMGALVFDALRSPDPGGSPDSDAAPDSQVAPVPSRPPTP